MKYWILLLPSLAYAVPCGQDAVYCDQNNTTLSGCTELKGGILNPDVNAPVNQNCKDNNPFLPFACTTQPMCQPLSGGFGGCRTNADCYAGLCNRDSSHTYTCQINSAVGIGCCVAGNGDVSNPDPVGDKWCMETTDCDVGQMCCGGKCAPEGSCCS